MLTDFDFYNGLQRSISNFTNRSNRLLAQMQ